MAELGAKFEVLETEAAGESLSTLRTVPAGVVLDAGEVRVGVDGAGHRHLLIPLAPGEAFAEDRGGRGVQFLRLTMDGVQVASLVCLVPELNGIFERLAGDVLGHLDAATSAARRAGEVLAEWKQLLAAATDGSLLTEAKLIGLLGELLCLESVVVHDPQLRVESWSGPLGSQHDFHFGPTSLEVKSTTIREGRVLSISSVDQLDPFPAESLFLVVFRFEPAPQGAGETVPGVVSRLLDRGVSEQALWQRLSQLGYSEVHVPEYRARAFALVDRRVYAVGGDFPKIVRSSFTTGAIPAGTLRLRYSIDLTNEPPAPLDMDVEQNLWRSLGEFETGQAS